MSSLPGEQRCPVLDASGRAVHKETADLRALGPAVRVELPGGVLAWAVTHDSIIRALTTDPRVSRDFRKHWPGAAELPKGWPLAPITLQQSFANTYGAEHRKLRGRIAPSFSARRVEGMRPQIQATADHLVGELAALPPGTVADARRALSLPLTMTVICDLFGVPHSMRRRLGAAIDNVLDTSVTMEEGLVRQTELHLRLELLLQHKEQQPGADLTSDLLASSAADEVPLTRQETLHTLFAMVGAGYETAVNLITSGLGALLTHPEHVDAVRRGAISWDDVIEETLRHEGPVMYLPLRYAIEDIDLGEGVLIRRGEPIIIAFAAAGRDPEPHPDHPDTFDPTRSKKTHLAFGHGPHFCLGAHLARLETHIALSTLFARLPHIALAEPENTPPRITSLIFNGPTHLNIVPTPSHPID